MPAQPGKDRGTLALCIGVIRLKLGGRREGGERLRQLSLGMPVQAKPVLGIRFAPLAERRAAMCDLRDLHGCLGTACHSRAGYPRGISGA